MCDQCNSNMAYVKYCTRCRQEFFAWPNQISEIHCKDCRKYHDCAICDTQTLNVMCDYCSKTCPICTCCRERLWSIPEYHYGGRYCSKCSSRLEEIIGDRSVVPGQQLLVRYEKNASTHDGYCSDAYDIEEEVTEIERYYPVLEEQIPLENYAIPPQGCCGCGTEYKPISSQIL